MPHLRRSLNELPLFSLLACEAEFLIDPSEFIDIDGGDYISEEPDIAETTQAAPTPAAPTQRPPPPSSPAPAPAPPMKNAVISQTEKEEVRVLQMLAGGSVGTPDQSADNQSEGSEDSLDALLASTAK